MKKMRSFTPLALLTALSASCSDDGDGSSSPAGASAPNAVSDEPGTSDESGRGDDSSPGSSSPEDTERTVNPARPAGSESIATEASGEPPALMPALPVVENPDHDALLNAADAGLAANKRLVYDMWRTLIEARDTVAAEPFFDPGYIQHNPNADTGRDGVMEFFSSLGPPLEVQDRVQTPLVAIVAERDFVALVQVDDRSEPMPYTTTWFDLFRIEGGVIAEHWDPATLPANGVPQGYVPPVENPDQQASLASDDASLASNKQLVHEAWRTLLDAQQVEEAPRFLADGYVQHNPLANTGLDGFLAFFRQFAQPSELQPGIDGFIEMIGEDDLVVLATVRPYATADGTPYTSTWFDMFRVSDGLLVEHWDTATFPVP